MPLTSPSSLSPITSRPIPQGTRVDGRWTSLSQNVTCSCSPPFPGPQRCQFHASDPLGTPRLEMGSMWAHFFQSTWVHQTAFFSQYAPLLGGRKNILTQHVFLGIARAASRLVESCEIVRTVDLVYCFVLVWSKTLKRLPWLRPAYRATASPMIRRRVLARDTHTIGVYDEELTASTTRIALPTHFVPPASVMKPGVNHEFHLRRD